MISRQLCKSVGDNTQRVTTLRGLYLKLWLFSRTIHCALQLNDFVPPFCGCVLPFLYNTVSPASLEVVKVLTREQVEAVEVVYNIFSHTKTR